MALKNIHFIGIGGISQSALAIILKANGYNVSGSDCTTSNITTKLEKLGIKVFIGHNANNVQGAQMVVYSSAIHASNPEMAEAQKLGIPAVSRASLLGAVAEAHSKVISISGCHGKTTATGMLATIFLLAKKNPTVHIGGNLPQINGNVRVGGKQYFITEACEYCDSFLSLNSFYSVVLNIQKDHMDYFKNMTKMQKSFDNFAKNTNEKGFLIINADDPLSKKLSSNACIVSFGINNSAHIMAKDIRCNKHQKYSYNLYVCGIKIARIKLSVSGRHNIYNSLASICVAICEGIGIRHIKRALKKYKSSERRFEQIKGTKATVVHDYAHHPTEIEASISTARKMCKGKLIVAFEPHTYSRTKYLFKEFGECFYEADKLYLCPIYPAREAPIKNITSQKLTQALVQNGVDAQCCESLQDCFNHLQKYNKKGNFILLLGAGTIVNLCENFKNKQPNKK